jgi:hypothetical protein
VVETLRDDDVPVIVDAMRTALATAEVRGET